MDGKHFLRLIHKLLGQLELPANRRIAPSLVKKLFLLLLAYSKELLLLYLILWTKHLS